jgi:hypothetical protein
MNYFSGWLVRASKLPVMSVGSLPDDAPVAPSVKGVRPERLRQIHESFVTGKWHRESFEKIAHRLQSLEVNISTARHKFKEIRAALAKNEPPARESLQDDTAQAFEDIVAGIIEYKMMLMSDDVVKKLDDRFMCALQDTTDIKTHFDIFSHNRNLLSQEKHDLKMSFLRQIGNVQDALREFMDLNRPLAGGAEEAALCPGVSTGDWPLALQDGNDNELKPLFSSQEMVESEIFRGLAESHYSRKSKKFENIYNKDENLKPPGLTFSEKSSGFKALKWDNFVTRWLLEPRPRHIRKKAVRLVLINPQAMSRTATAPVLLSLMKSPYVEMDQIFKGVRKPEVSAEVCNYFANRLPIGISRDGGRNIDPETQYERIFSSTDLRDGSPHPFQMIDHLLINAKDNLELQSLARAVFSMDDVGIARLKAFGVKQEQKINASYVQGWFFKTYENIVADNLALLRKVIEQSDSPLSSDTYQTLKAFLEVAFIVGKSVDPPGKEIMQRLSRCLENGNARHLNGEAVPDAVFCEIFEPVFSKEQYKIQDYVEGVLQKSIANIRDLWREKKKILQGQGLKALIERAKNGKKELEGFKSEWFKKISNKTKLLGYEAEFAASVGFYDSIVLNTYYESLSDLKREINSFSGGQDELGRLSSSIGLAIKDLKSLGLAGNDLCVRIIESYEALEEKVKDLLGKK